MYIYIYIYIRIQVASIVLQLELRLYQVPNGIEGPSRVVGSPTGEGVILSTVGSLNKGEDSRHRSVVLVEMRLGWPLCDAVPKPVVLRRGRSRDPHPRLEGLVLLSNQRQWTSTCGGAPGTPSQKRHVSSCGCECGQQLPLPVRRSSSMKRWGP